MTFEAIEQSRAGRSIILDQYRELLLSRLDEDNFAELVLAEREVLHTLITGCDGDNTALERLR